MNRADARTRQHCDRGFWDHAHVDTDAVARFHAKTFEPVRKAADLTPKLAIRIRDDLTGFPFPDDRGLIAAGTIHPAIETVVGKVRFSAEEPLRVRRLPLGDLVERFKPMELLGLLLPERIRVRNALLIKRVVFRAA